MAKSSHERQRFFATFHTVFVSQGCFCMREAVKGFGAGACRPLCGIQASGMPETARSAFSATMRASRVGSPTYVRNEGFKNSDLDVLDSRKGLDRQGHTQEEKEIQNQEGSTSMGNGRVFQYSAAQWWKRLQFCAII